MTSRQTETCLGFWWTRSSSADTNLLLKPDICRYLKRSTSHLLCLMSSVLRANSWSTSPANMRSNQIKNQVWLQLSSAALNNAHHTAQSQKISESYSSSTLFGDFA